MVDLLARRQSRLSGDRRETAGDGAMTCNRICAAAIGIALVVTQPTLPARQQEPAATFRSGADVVSVEASVRRDKRPLTGLKLGDFELLDNGVAQEISDLNYERLPIDVTVVLDVSASVTGAVLDQLRQSVRQLKADLGA